MTWKEHLRNSGLALGLLITVGLGTSYGQGHTWMGESLARMVEGARWHFGRLRLNAALSLANVGRDSDIYFGYFGVDSVPDWTFTAGTPFQLLLPLSRNIVLDLNDTPQYLFYLDTEAERAFNNTFRGAMHFAGNRIYIQAGGRLADVRRRFSPELDVNVREKRNGLDGLILWQASRRTSLALMYGRARYAYDDIEYLGGSLAERLNRDEDLLDVMAFVQPGPRTRLSIDGQYGTYAFEAEAGAGRNSKSFGLFGGIELIPRAGEVAESMGMQGKLKLGYLRLDLSDPGLPDGAGLAGEADLSVSLTRRTAVRVFFSRGFEFSVFSGAAYYRATRFGAGLLQSLSRKASLSYDLSFGRNDYPTEGEIQGPGDRLALHRIGLNLTLARDLVAALFGTIGHRTRAGLAEPRDRYFLGINLTYGAVGRELPLSPGGTAR
jgi:hypothetical protein